MPAGNACLPRSLTSLVFYPVVADHTSGNKDSMSCVASCLGGLWKRDQDYTAVIDCRLHSYSCKQVNHSTLCFHGFKIQ